MRWGRAVVPAVTKVEGPDEVERIPARTRWHRVGVSCYRRELRVNRKTYTAVSVSIGL